MKGLTLDYIGVVLVAAAMAGCGALSTWRDAGREEGAMDNEKLQTIVERLARDVEGDPGYWTFTVASRPLVVITDEAADRMRIMSPVLEDAKLSTEEARVLLEANFDRALDARYAVARGYVWSAFIHPLSSLSEAQFIDSVQQVVTLAENYGGSYSSTNLVFQGGQN